MNKTIGWAIGVVALGVTAFVIAYGWEKGKKKGSLNANGTDAPDAGAGKSGKTKIKPGQGKGHCFPPDPRHLKYVIKGGAEQYKYDLQAYQNCLAKG